MAFVGMKKSTVSDMARYGDLDAVKLKVQRYLIPNTDEFGMVNAEVAERWFLKLLEETPTADVVPKSEYEALKEMLDATIAGQETLQKTLDSRTRKIFWEIEKVIGNQYEYYVFDNLDIEGVEQDAIIAFADTMKRHFAELKKKYTEGEK